MSSIKNVQTFVNNIDMNTTNKIVNLGTPTSNADAATKLYVDTAAGGGASAWSTFAATQAVSLASHQINNVSNPTAAQDATTKTYTDAGDAAWATHAASQVVSMATFKITDLGTPTLNTDAATKQYVDINSGDPSTWSAFPATNQVAMDTFQIQGLGDPTLAQDAATKAYVDATAASPFVSMSVASTSNTPAALATIAVASNTAVSLFGYFTSKGTATADTAGGFFFASAYNNAGVLTLTGTSFILNNASGAQTFDVVVSGANLVIQVTGIVAVNANWAGAYTKTVQA